MIFWACILSIGGYHGSKNEPQLKLDLGQPTGSLDRSSGTFTCFGSDGGEYDGLLFPPLLFPKTYTICDNDIIDIWMLIRTSINIGVDLDGVHGCETPSIINTQP